MQGEVTSGMHPHELARVRLRRYHPNKLTRTSYNVHAGQHADTCDTQRGEFARKDLDLLLHLKPEEGSKEEQFWSDITDDTTSLGGALTREKDLWIQRKNAARSQRNTERARVIETTRHNWFVAILWILGRTAFFFALGYLLAEALPWIPERLTKSTGETSSFFVGIAVAALMQMFRGLMSIWKANQRALTEEEFHRTLRAADREYNLAKIRQLEYHWKLFCKSWEAFTGTAYTEPPWYLEMMQDDLVSNDRWDMQMERQASRGVRRMYKFLHRLIHGRKRRIQDGTVR